MYIYIYRCNILCEDDYAHYFPELNPLPAKFDT
jgi:hypothetical protein